MESYNIAILGDEKVGKTTYINTLCQKNANNIEKEDKYCIKWNNDKYIITDTKIDEKTDGIILMFDINQPKTFEYIEKVKISHPVILVGTKSDLPFIQNGNVEKNELSNNKNENRWYIKKWHELNEKINGIKLCIISSKKFYKIKEPIEILIKYMNEYKNLKNSIKQKSKLKSLLCDDPETIKLCEYLNNKYNNNSIKAYCLNSALISVYFKNESTSAQMPIFEIWNNTNYNENNDAITSTITKIIKECNKVTFEIESYVETEKEEDSYKIKHVLTFKTGHKADEFNETEINKEYYDFIEKFNTVKCDFINSFQTNVA